MTAARRWVASFVHWYNDIHRHSEIHCVTPAQRHVGLDGEILRRRHHVLSEAKARHPARWSGAVRNCQPVGAVWLIPDKDMLASHDQKELEAA